MSAYQTEPPVSEYRTMRIYRENGELEATVTVFAPTAKAAVIQTAEGDGRWEHFSTHEDSRPNEHAAEAGYSDQYGY